MGYLPNFIFLILLAIGIGFFIRNMGRLKRSILIGKPAGRVDNKKARWQRMIRLALGQSKMGVKPLAGVYTLSYIWGLF